MKPATILLTCACVAQFVLLGLQEDRFDKLNARLKHIEAERERGFEMMRQSDIRYVENLYRNKYSKMMEPVSSSAKALGYEPAVIPILQSTDPVVVNPARPIYDR